MKKYRNFHQMTDSSIWKELMNTVKKEKTLIINGKLLY